MAYGCHLGLPFSSSMVVFGKVQQDMGLRAREVKDYLTRFAKINRAKDGHLTLGDLAEFLGVPVDSELRDIFDGGSSEVYFLISALGGGGGGGSFIEFHKTKSNFN